MVSRSSHHICTHEGTVNIVHSKKLHLNSPLANSHFIRSFIKQTDPNWVMKNQKFPILTRADSSLDPPPPVAAHMLFLSDHAVQWLSSEDSAPDATFVGCITVYRSRARRPCLTGACRPPVRRRLSCSLTCRTASWVGPWRWPLSAASDHCGPWWRPSCRGRTWRDTGGDQRLASGSPSSRGEL